MPNRLQSEKSPYLLQHKNNPVDWYPWSEEAFAKAKELNLPIFLSIGYSTCHWCHVMERESFEHQATADVLNANFICIKVDREERPDVDAIYMSATQAMTGAGGWPMSCFLTPELQPFFCGTYYPPIPSYGKPSFVQLLERISELWRERRDDIIASAAELTTAISERAVETTSESSLEHSVDACADYFKSAFDTLEGGFGSAPKFPRPVQFDFLFQYYNATGDEGAKNMALFTLKKMALGGINDQLSGGFHRYSVDNRWFASHFEKMLYDQAQLLDSYLDAFQITGDRFYADVAMSIADFVLSDMTDQGGGFYSAYDADSEGVEGKCYIWSAAEIDESLDTVDAKLFKYRFGITDTGNWEEGSNILFRDHTAPQTATEFSLPLDVVRSRLEESRKKLLSLRKKRIQPHLDDKILTSWNGLMIGALARSADILSDERYRTAAANAGNFIWNELHENTGNALFHRFRDGEAKFPAYLDSYAFLIKGYLRLYESTFDSIWLERAIALQSEQDAIFFDTKNGAYFSSRKQDDLIVQTKNDYDGAEPSGNSIAAQNLLRLFVITANDEYKKQADATIEYYASRLKQYPYTMPELLISVLWNSNPVATIVYSGKPDAERRKEFASLISKRYSPLLNQVYADNSNASLSEFTRSLASGSEYKAFYCHDQRCELPVTSATELLLLLGKAITN